MARFSMTLERHDGHICCRSCKTPIAAVTESWKARAALNVMAVARLPGADLGWISTWSYGNSAAPRAVRSLMRKPRFREIRSWKTW